MPLPVTPAKEFLSQPVLRLSRLGFFDFIGDPLRATDAPDDLDLVGTGDTELDGVYFAIDGQLIDISPIAHTKENSNQVSVTLSGLITLDDDLMTLLGNRSNWVGREAIIWYMLHEEDTSTVGVPWRHYTGRMVNVTYSGDETSAIIKVSVENYLASLSQASNRTWLSQAEFDAADTSAAASVAAANSRTPGGGGVFGSGGNHDGGSFDRENRTRRPGESFQ
jgi:hypothetical protein